MYWVGVSAGERPELVAEVALVEEACASSEVARSTGPAGLIANTVAVKRWVRPAASA